MDVFNVDPENPRRTLIWGPVASAKTGMLAFCIKRVNRQQLTHLTFLPSILCPGDEAEHHSRDGVSFSGVPFRTLEAAKHLVLDQKPQVVFIEEVQFIAELAAFLDFLSNEYISVIMTGLSMRDDGEPWPVIRDIIHTCNVVQLTGICYLCGSTNALYSQNVTGKSTGPNHILIDTVKQPEYDQFRPACRSCFHVIEDTPEAALERTLKTMRLDFGPLDAMRSSVTLYTASAPMFVAKFQPHETPTADAEPTELKAESDLPTLV